MQIIRPLSVAARTPDYYGALPPPSYELCGDKGVYVAVGYSPAYLVYRGTWDANKNSGSWNWVYSKIT